MDPKAAASQIEEAIQFMRDRGWTVEPKREDRYTGFRYSMGPGIGIGQYGLRLETSFVEMAKRAGWSPDVKGTEKDAQDMK